MPHRGTLSGRGALAMLRSLARHPLVLHPLVLRHALARHALALVSALTQPAERAALTRPLTRRAARARPGTAILGHPLPRRTELALGPVLARPESLARRPKLSRPRGALASDTLPPAPARAPWPARAWP